MIRKLILIFLLSLIPINVYAEDNFTEKCMDYLGDEKLCKEEQEASDSPQKKQSIDIKKYLNLVKDFIELQERYEELKDKSKLYDYTIKTTRDDSDKKSKIDKFKENKYITLVINNNGKWSVAYWDDNSKLQEKPLDEYTDLIDELKKSPKEDRYTINQKLTFICERKQSKITQEEFQKEKEDAILVIASIGVVLFLLLLWNLILQFGIKMRKTSIKELERSIQALKKKFEEINSYSINTGKLQSDFNGLKKELENIQNDIELLKEKPTVAQTTTKYSFSIPTKPAIENTIEFYLARPFRDGFFDAAYEKPKFVIAESIYLCKSNSSNPNQAWISFLNEHNNFEKATQNPESYILPACDIENRYFVGAKKIVTVKEGTIQKNAGRWNIIQKAKVRYE